MLVLTRVAGKAVTIGENIEIKILGVRGNTVRLGIEAPRDLPVHRLEVFNRITQGKKGDAYPR